MTYGYTNNASDDVLPLAKAVLGPLHFVTPLSNQQHLVYDANMIRPSTCAAAELEGSVSKVARDKICVRLRLVADTESILLRRRWSMLRRCRKTIVVQNRVHEATGGHLYDAK